MRPFWREQFAITVAAAAWCATFLPLALPMWCGIAALVAAALMRFRVALLIGVAIAVAVCSAHALEGLRDPPTGEWSGPARLVGDPDVRGAATVVAVATGVGRLEARAWGAAGRLLAQRSNGDIVVLTGRLSPLGSAWSVARHQRARLDVERTSPSHRRWWVMQIPATIRSLVIDGAGGLPPDQRSVYTGFVLGDDRGRSDEVTEWFQRAGLSHLLVVSGQNVLFVMFLCAPILRRAAPRLRLAATVAVLVLFAAVTGFEPSVLRAATMAGVAALAVFLGRPADGRRVLAVAVTVLVLVDPLLTRSVGFLLSVAASGGIVLLAPRIESALPGPRRLRSVVAVTVAAQLAVAPILVPMFGPMPLVSIPANVLVEPLAALVMMWGSSVGVVAGLFGGPIDTLLQLPVRVGLWWIMGVARVASSLPVPSVGLAPLAFVVVAVCGAVGLRRIVGRSRGAITVQSTIVTGGGR